MGTAHVAEVQQNVAVANLPINRGSRHRRLPGRRYPLRQRGADIPTLPDRANGRETVPVCVVRSVCGQACGDGVVKIALLPDARVVDEIDGTSRHGIATHAGHQFAAARAHPNRPRIWDHGRASDLLPFQEQRITRHCHHVAQLVTVINGNDAVAPLPDVDPDQQASSGPGEIA